VSGVKADIGLTGGTIQVETLQSLVAGGIAFTTPEQNVGARVRSGQSFPLYEKADEEWLGWSPRLVP
jgi:paraquat-inducible protein B